MWPGESISFFGMLDYGSIVYNRAYLFLLVMVVATEDARNAITKSKMLTETKLYCVCVRRHMHVHGRVLVDMDESMEVHEDKDQQTGN